MSHRSIPPDSARDHTFVGFVACSCRGRGWLRSLDSSRAECACTCLARRRRMRWGRPSRVPSPLLSHRASSSSGETTAHTCAHREMPQPRRRPDPADSQPATPHHASANPTRRDETTAAMDVAVAAAGRSVKVRRRVVFFPPRHRNSCAPGSRLPPGLTARGIDTTLGSRVDGDLRLRLR